jgi:hypothetical protein
MILQVTFTEISTILGTFVTINSINIAQPAGFLSILQLNLEHFPPQPVNIYTK